MEDSYLLLVDDGKITLTSGTGFILLSGGLPPPSPSSTDTFNQPFSQILSSPFGQIL